MSASPSDRAAALAAGAARLRQRRNLSIVVGGLFSAVLVAFAFSKVNWSDLTATVAHADLWPWLPLAVLSYLLGHLVRGLRCRLLVSEDTHLTVPLASNIVVLGYAANNVFPARLGEFVRAGMLAERTGLPVSQALSVTFLERVLDAAVIFFLLLLTGGVLGFSELLLAIVPLAAAVVGVGVAAFVVLAAFPGPLVSAATYLGARLSPSLHAQVVRLVVFVAQGTSALRRPRKALLVIAQSLVVWLFEAGMFLALLPAFGLPLSPTWALLAMTVTNLGILVPSTPGFIGTFHVFCAAALATVGVPEAVGVPYATVVHLAFFVPITLWGGLAALWYGVRFGQTLATVQVAREASGQESDLVPGAEVIAVLPPAEPDSPPSAFMIALTDALVHRAVSHLDAATRARVVGRTAAFVDGQIRAVRPTLRLALTVGLAGFRFLVRVTTARGFCDLSRERQVSIVEWWCYGPVTLTRMMMRAPRSTALLAVYENPEVLPPVADPRSGRP